MYTDDMHVYPVGVIYPMLLVFTHRKVFRLRTLKRVFRGKQKVRGGGYSFPYEAVRDKNGKTCSMHGWRQRSTCTIFIGKSDQFWEYWDRGVHRLFFKHFDFPVLSFYLPSTLRSLDTDSASDHKERLRG